MRVRMTGIFLLLILAAMMLIGGYLWLNLEHFYHEQHTDQMLRSVRSYIIPAEQYFLLGEEIAALEEEIAALDPVQQPTAYAAAQEELKAFVDERTMYKNTLSELSSPTRTPSQSETAEYFQVAVLDLERNIVVQGSGITYFQATPPSTFLEAIAGSSTQVRQLQSVSGQIIRIIAYPLLYEGTVLGLIYIESEATGLGASMAALRDMIIVATFGALVCTSLVSFFLANSITAPITRLTQRAQSLALGDYTTQIEVGSKDEVGHLADTFNALTVRLKESMEEIADEKGKMEAMLSYMAEGVIAVDEQGLVMHLNPSARRMFNLGAEYIGAPLNDFLGNLEQEIGWQRALLRQEMVATELTLPPEWGSLVLRAHSAPFFTAGAETPAGVVMVLTDTTDEERLEETRRDFIANVSHELRTPLTTIKSYLETLLDGARHAQELSTSFLTVVLQETDRMSRLVSELLTLAQLDAPSQLESLDIHDLKLLLRSVAREMQPQFTSKNQEFILELNNEEVAFALAPIDRIEQVCGNLLANASKYTPEGGKVHLSLATGLTGNEIIISDNGIGIAPEHLPRVFERFYRVDKGRSRVQGGTGLGLAIAKQIIEKLGGTISIASTLGQGTEVTVWLPKPEQFAIWSGYPHD